MSDQLLVLSLAFLAYVAAVNYSGNGFVAAFVAGLVFGTASRGQLAQGHRVHRHRRPVLLIRRLGHLRRRVRRTDTRATACISDLSSTPS